MVFSFRKFPRSVPLALLLFAFLLHPDPTGAVEVTPSHNAVTISQVDFFYPAIFPGSQPNSDWGPPRGDDGGFAIRDQHRKRVSECPHRRRMGGPESLGGCIGPVSYHQ